MNKAIKIIISITLVFTYINANAQNTLLNCWKKQVKPIKDEYLTFSYSEKLNQLEHSFEPWQQTNYIGKGTIWSNADTFLKQDTLNRGKRVYYSKTNFNNSELLFLNYGDKELFPVTKKLFEEQMFRTARYTPVNLINYFLDRKIDKSDMSDIDLSVYTTTINKTIVTLYISNKDNLLRKTTTLSYDELFGDILTTFNYTDYIETNNIHHPTKILIDKINGNLKDEVLIYNLRLSKTIPRLLEKPTDYKFAKPTQTKYEIKTEKFNEHIYFVELKHTDDRVMIVEFSDFLLVAEAPINSKNGELIIAEAKKIAPNKPIKYFVFGHYHEHYLGGMRPFIHKGAKIICSEINREYVKYIANAPHTLNPDSLHIEPKPLQIENINDSLTISDGNYKMIIYFIGEKSQHTKDYLIYYFPTEKILFEDDLVWIKREGEIEKAGKRQEGLYNAIMELNLDIEIIIQSWPVADYGVKTIIPFKDLEASIKKE